MALGVLTRAELPNLHALSSPEKTLSSHPSLPPSLSSPSDPSTFTTRWSFRFQMTTSRGKILISFIKGKKTDFSILEKLISGKDEELSECQPLWADNFTIQ